MADDAEVPRASTAQPNGLKAFSINSIKSSLQFLAFMPWEQLAVENYEEVDQAVTRVLIWLHRQSVASPLQANSQAGQSLLSQTQHLFHQWHELHQSDDKPMNTWLWMLWVELGCKLTVLHCSEVKQVENCVNILAKTKPPRDFPVSATHFFRKEKQVAFSCELWDSVVAKPLSDAPANVVRKVMPELVTIFLHWMAFAMRGYELIFIANVATPFRRHVQAAPLNISQLADAWLNVATCKLKMENDTKFAAFVSIKALILSVFNSTRSPETARWLETLSAATVKKLSLRPYPDLQNPTSGVALALGIAYLDDARYSSSLFVPKRSGNATLLCQFALLRLISLQLLSPRIKPYNNVATADYQAHVQQSLKALILEPSHEAMQEYALRMVEICIEDMIEYFQSSRQVYFSLIKALQSVLPPDIFLPNGLNSLQSTCDRAARDETLLASASDIVAFIKRCYEGVAPLLEVLSNRYIVRSFLALSRMEFARKVCAWPGADVFMQAVRQRLELELKQSITPSELIFSPIFQSLTTRRSISVIPFEANFITGCQILAVGLVMQCKLRILLFQCTSLIDEALAVVFSGLYNVFQPVNEFAHYFLGVCLSHLGHFFPLWTVYPHYLQVTLAAYPITASRQALAKVCGAIFGSLFSSKALIIPSKQENKNMEAAQKMTVWAIRRCCDRCYELLIKEDRLSTNLTKDVKSPESHSGDKQPTIKARTFTIPSTTSETDGFYLVGLVFELLKMTPVNILKASAMEVEQLFTHWDSNSLTLCQLKKTLFARISQNCEAEKRAWIAAWYIEVDSQYPLTVAIDAVVMSRL